MDYEWDEGKARANRSKHGVEFECVRDFDWESALILEDERTEYGEVRFRAMGLVRGRLHALVFSLRGDAIRIISLRKANPREVKAYETRI